MMTYPSSETSRDLMSLGILIYERDLRARLEKEFDRQYVAIHVDTGDYEVAKTTASATRELLRRHEIDGRLFIRRIGNEPEYSLMARLTGMSRTDQKPE